MGSQVQVTWAVGNAGQAPAIGAWNEKLYASPNDQVGGDILLATLLLEEQDLPVGATVERAQAITVPELPNGYHLVVCLDTTNAIAETDEQNNCDISEQSGVLLPDLQPVIVVGPVDTLADDQVTINWEVVNAGVTTAEGSWADKLYLEDDAGEQISLTSVTRLGPLQPGTSYVGSVEVHVPSRIAGSYTLCVETNALNTISEPTAGQENRLCNDGSPMSITQPPRANLQVEAFDVPAGGLVGDEFVFEYSVTNSGEADATGSWADRVIAENVQTGERFDYSDFFRNGTIAIGQTVAYQQALPYPSPPGEYRLIVITDRTDLVNEGLTGGEADNERTSTDTFQSATYDVTAVVDPDDIDAVLGETIELTGQARSLETGELLAGVPVALQFAVRNTTRIISRAAGGEPIMTNENGEYAYSFTPLPNEAGQYGVVAGPPPDLGTEVDATFRIYGMRPRAASRNETIYPGEPRLGSFTIFNAGDLIVSGIQVTVGSTPPGLSAEAYLSASALAPLGDPSGLDRLSLTYRLESPDGNFPPGNVELILTSSEGAQSTLTIAAAPRPLPVQFTAAPTSLTAAMKVPTHPDPNAPGGRQRTTFVQFQVANIGSGISGPVEIRIPAAPWLSLASPQLMDPIAPGASATVLLALRPSYGLQLGEYPGSVVIVDTNVNSSAWVSVPFVFRATSDATGTLEIVAADEGSYWGAGGDEFPDGSGPKLSGATVKLAGASGRSTTRGLAFEGTTDETGRAVFADIPEGYYNVEVSDDRHLAYRGLAQVANGEIRELTSFLPYRGVTYSWDVVPVDFEDVYIFTLHTVFETFVPAPVVTVKIAPDQEPFVDLTQITSEVTQVDFIVTNEGLIRADDVRLSFTSSERFEVVPLIEELGDMEAQQSYTVPVLIIDHEYGTRGNVNPCGVSGGLVWSLVCGERHWYSSPVYFANPDAGCGATGAGGGGGGGAAGGGPGDPYVDDPSYNLPALCETPPVPPNECPNPCGPPAAPQCCANGDSGAGDNATSSSGTGASGGAASGDGPNTGNAAAGQGEGCHPQGGNSDPLYYFSGEFVHQVEDLRIRGRGLDFVWQRRYRSKIGPNTAQGNGWDFSYNVWLEEDSGNLVLHTGGGRRDVFTPQPGGIWGRDEYFIEFSFDETLGAYVATYSNGGRWEFLPFDGSPAGGKLAAIVDRNGNTISLEYDPQGRLWKVRDTLNVEEQDNRVIDVAYNGDGLIESVTDFTGRQVRYQYYQDGDPDGSAGDLKSVTLPAVVGTPNGNDFSDGKTVTYTYSTGFADPRLNHNLLTITDGRRNDPADPTFGSGPRLENVYTTTTNPDDRNFDRVATQIWGGDRIDFAYVPTVPLDENRQSVMTTVVNDRDGLVTEYDFDIRNRLVARRDYTGFADPTRQTTLTANRPTDRLRPGDPPYFEKAYTWNNDAKATSITNPDGDVMRYVYELEMDQNASRRTRGNLVSMIHRSGSHPVPGDQLEIAEEFQYRPEQGSCCGADFVSDYTNARGFLTHHEYDDFGNRTETRRAVGAPEETLESWVYNEFGQMIEHTHPANDTGYRRRDVYAYYGPEDGYQNGYLKQQIVDADGEQLTTNYEYDAVGNVVRVIDPRDNDTIYIVNEHDQIVREISRPVQLDGGEVRYERDYYYDANNNLVRIDVQNVDDAGAVQANTHFTTAFQYDALDQLVRKTEEVDEDHSIATEYEYDGNRNRTMVKYGEATSGRQPSDIVETLYDERDLPYQEIRAFGHDEQSTTQFNYDRNGRLTTRIEGIESGGHAHRYIYDSYGRVKYAVDPMGNVTTNTYDAQGNLVDERVDGELNDENAGGYGCDVLELLSGVPPYLCDLPDPSNVRLSETTYVYDALDRLTQTAEAFFDVTTGAPIDDGLSVTTNYYTENSQVYSVEDDRGNATITSYDTANRRSVVTDAKGNATTYSYDRNSNVIQMVEVDKSDLGNPDQLFTTTFAYDALDRQTSTTDNIGNTNRSFYDSRSDRVRTVDALDHEIRYVFDGLSRLTKTVRDMDDNGADPAAMTDGMVNPDIVTTQGWDDSSRLITQTDDNGNTTTYVYDGLNRKVAEVYADTTRKDFTFDPHDNNVFWTDANGNQVTQTYDDNDRLVRRDVIPGPGVSDDTTFEVYKYDGLSRLTWAEDDDTLVTRGYDSLGRVTTETQDLYDDPNTDWPTAVVGSVYDGVGNLVTLTYPSGLIVTTTYDALNRKKTISDQNGQIAEYWYVGPTRVERRDYGNGTRSEWTYDGITGIDNPPGDFGVQRIIRTNHFRIADGTTIDDRVYTWDAMGNKTSREDIRADGPRLRHEYQYDNCYRLVRSEQSDLSGVLQTIDYRLDGVGNRTEVVGGSHSGEYYMNSANGDAMMNRYTQSPAGSLIYDHNGNTIGIVGSASRVFAVDSRNRIVGVLAGTNTKSVYDSLNRMARRGGSLRIVSSISQELQTGVDDTVAQNVYGTYVDDLLYLRSDAGVRYIYSDDMFNVAAIASGESVVLERYEYDDYGDPTFLDPTSHKIAGSAYFQSTLFSGRRWCGQEEAYYFRNRFLSTAIGRFSARDPIGAWVDAKSIGSAYSYGGSNPWSQLDPTGLLCIPLPSEKTSWVDTGGKRRVRIELKSVINDDFFTRRTVCVWHRITEGIFKRSVTPRMYCCGHENCGGFECGISKGKPRTEYEWHVLNREVRTSSGVNYSSGADPESSDRYICSDPFTGYGHGGSSD